MYGELSLSSSSCIPVEWCHEMMSFFFNEQSNSYCVMQETHILSLELL